ncbi:hypothetical protein [Winogradskyella sp. A3E31]|uniref:hypothetical protein n=1 Tax=Winogradskyella sp. A3E31 TaxID=3349637 RepID=UPI00398B23D7
MRTDNEKVRGIIVSVYFVLIILAIILATVFGAFSELSENPALTFSIIFLVFVALLLMVYLISRYFEYDSDGVKVVVTNKGLLLGDRFNYREHKIEFYKKNLVGFKFRNYLIYKTLKLLIRHSNGKTKKYVFNVTLVQKKKRKYIKKSLRKMLRENAKNNTE